jgi:hypothetical protein
METLTAQCIKRNKILNRCKSLLQTRRMKYSDYRTLIDALPVNKAEFNFDRPLSVQDICDELKLSITIKQ